VGAGRSVGRDQLAPLEADIVVGRFW